MKLSRIALSALLAAGLSCGAFALQQTPDASAAPAQGPRGPHKMDPDHQLKHLTKLLSLTDDQQAKIKPILADRDQQLMALRDDTSTDRKARFQKAHAISQDSETKMEALLTDDQKKKYEDFKEQRKAEMKEHHGHGQQQNGAAPNAAPAPAPAAQPNGN